MTKIEWVARPDTTPKTWNPVTGCTPVSEGCKNCYAKRMARRLAGRYGYPEYPDHFSVTLHNDRVDQPFKWKKPCTIFVCSMSDLFHPGVAFEFIAEVVDILEATPQHTYIILTKRPGQMLDFCNFMHRENYDPSVGLMGFAEFPPNVWVGVSAENQRWADERIPILLQVPARVRFVSSEPMLERIDFSQYLSPHCNLCGGSLDVEHADERKCSRPYWGHENKRNGLDWVIVGGETGPGARPIFPDWAREIRDQCRKARIAFFMKQMSRRHQTPADLMIREFPA